MVIITFPAKESGFFLDPDGFSPRARENDDVRKRVGGEAPHLMPCPLAPAEERLGAPQKLYCPVSSRKKHKPPTLLLISLLPHEFPCDNEHDHADVIVWESIVLEEPVCDVPPPFPPFCLQQE